MFIHSLPVFFTHIGYASPLELLVIFLGLFIVLFMATQARGENGPLQQGDYLFAAWSGKVKLAWAFWPFFLVLNASLYAADILATTGIFTVSSWDDIHIALLLPIVWWATSVWRCSANSTARAWGACARLMTISVFFEYGLKLLIRMDYPRLFFNCEELLLDYGSCF
ncbi:MAG: hypothetical protein Q7U57_00685 [Methylovulum sp.]|nr:hypothetical protein [Methylovulum sp.]